MASTSSSTSFYNYDVFLSFRGEDTRHSFTDHLYNALNQAGISTFRDADEIREGQRLNLKIERSIIQSRASIIVLSENFANSSWCLDELWLILQRNRNGNYFVLPVFYKVDPSDVRNQRGSFAIEAKEGVTASSKWTENNVNRWKQALTEIANLKGMVVSGYETNFIANIVDKVYRELDLKLFNTPTDLTGIETRAQGVNSWLKCEHPGSPVLAICGMGGSGKTTLARYIYNSNKQYFESSSFLETIENQPAGLLDLKKQLIRDVLGKNRRISNVSEGTFQIEKAIQRKKVLIVVDDIDDKEKLSTLFGSKVFRTQSKIIITTRLLNIDTWFGSISFGCHVHRLQLLNDHESLELLSCHAFASKIPMKGFEELAVQVAQYCGGNPLALKVLGSSLSIRAHDQWTRNNMIEIWKSKMNSLNSLKGDLDCKIQGVLQRSFESLPCKSHKELFLHIGCLFVGEYASDVEKILDKDWYAKSGIMTLVNRCLLIVSKDRGRLEMHKLLQDMARNIVHDESIDPAKRSRVWHHEESYHLLSKGDGSETIEGLALNMLRFEEGMRLETFNTSSLVKMKNLKFLHLNFVKLTGSYKNFPDLRWLRWRGCNIKTITPCLLMSCLVAIDMRYGDLEKFDLPMVLNSLKILDLSYSCKLVSIHNLYRLPKLEVLDLGDCISLTHVCKTIGDLNSLFFLRMRGCTKLWKALSNQNQLERLKAFLIGGGVPEQPCFPLPQSLVVLYLMSNPFEILPNYIELKMLWSLDLSCCPNLKSLPCLPSTLKELYVDWCTSLENITFQSGRFTLEVFNYEGCFKLYEIEGLFKLVSIAKLDEADLEHMQWIKAYQDHKVELVGDVITEGRSFNIQMLYEYGIRSVYLQGIEDQSMMGYEYKSSSNFLSFRVPLHPKKRQVQGLSVMVLYRSSFDEDSDPWFPFFAKISNRSKGVSWVYNPVVYCIPRVDNDVLWLSYWPIGNILDVGDEICVDIIMCNELMIVRECSASLVYMDDGEVGKEEITMKGEEVIGRDLSQFKVIEGGYYLCRRDLFESRTSNWLKWLFGDDSLYTASRRWRVSSQSEPVFQVQNTFRNINHNKITVELGVNFDNESETNMIKKAICGLGDVESVSTQKEIGRLIVRGQFDPQAVATRVREFEKMVQILNVKFNKRQHSSPSFA